MATNPSPTQWAAALLNRLGIPQSPGAVQALVGWQRAEGGHTNNQARWNYLNTTMPEPGAGNTGSQGNIKVYRSFEQGLQATADTLRNGRYGGILAGLRSGNPAAVANAIGQSPWGTNGGLVRQAIMGTKAPVGAVPVRTSAPAGSNARTTTTTTTPGVDNSALRRQLVADFLQQGGVKSSGASLAFASGIQGAQDVPASTSTRTSVSAPRVSTPSQGSGRYPLAQTGKLIGFPYQGTHTLGNWQSDRAYDIAVPVGTPMLALQDGVVVKVTRHPQGSGRFAGDQITVQGANGNEYFYAHGKASVQAGQRVRKGQELGTSGSANGVAHLHYAQMRGNPKQHLTGS